MNGVFAERDYNKTFGVRTGGNPSDFYIQGRGQQLIALSPIFGQLCLMTTLLVYIIGVIFIRGMSSVWARESGMSPFSVLSSPHAESL